MTVGRPGAVEPRVPLATIVLERIDGSQVELAELADRWLVVQSLRYYG